jgi:hypothetical protein
MIKVGELIQKLQELDQDALVVLSSDGEGNQYSPLADVEAGKYAAENTWRGEFYSEADEDWFAEDAVKCVGLWPTN